MAKQKKRTRPSWFKKQVDRYQTVDFLDKKPPLDIQREAMFIVRDIARDNITPNDFKYLFDNKILANVKIAIEEKYIELQTYFASMSFVMSSPNGIMILEQTYGTSGQAFQKIFNDTQNNYMAYGIVLKVIIDMIGFVNSPYVKTEEMYMDVYRTVQYQLSRFRYIL